MLNWLHGYWLITNKRTIYAAVCLLMTAMNGFAEGSKELNASGGNRAFLFSGTSGSPSFPFPTQGTMKVYAKAGESIYFGSSAQGMGAGTMLIRAPDGQTYTSGSSATIGLIANRAQEVAGPSPNAGGYTPYIQTVLASQSGVWEVDFIPPSPLSNNVTPTASNANWVQSVGQYICAFDVSVRNTANTAFLTGRVYTNIFMGLLGAYDIGFNAVVKVLTKDGYLYNLNNNGQAGDGFSFFANNKGFRTSTGAPSYKSVDNVTNFDVQDPTKPDTQSDITHKLFFNTPAADLPATANTPGGGTTWLLNTPVIPTITNVTFTGTEGTLSKGGTNPLGGNIGFTASNNGRFVVTVDVNHNGLFTDAIDRKMTGIANQGTNTIYWDGLDGLGAAAPAGTYNLNINVLLNGGEVHFPFFDVERNVNGILLTRLNGYQSPADTVYWDDSPISVVGTPSNPVTNLTGLSSTVNGHKWGTAGAGPLEFGNEKSIDTWAYVSAAPLVATLTAQLVQSDLEVVSLNATPACTGQSVVITAVVRNNGPSDVVGAKFALTYPAAITGVTVTGVKTTGTSTISAATTGATEYDATLSMANGAVITYTLTGFATSVPSGGFLNTTASLLRPTDVTDPDATNPDTAPPTDALAECNSLPSGTGCNNIKSATTTVGTKPNAGPDQTVVKNTIATMAAIGTATWSQIGSTPSVAVISNNISATTTITGFSVPGNYNFIYANGAGCADTAVVHVLDDIAIPNIITPNGDGKNDTFQIVGLSSFPNSELLIFNRWGGEVYRSPNYLNDWMGTGLSEGTYYYILHRKELSGSITTFKGWVYLKR